jgi:hypothetical protein
MFKRILNTLFCLLIITSLYGQKQKLDSINNAAFNKCVSVDGTYFLSFFFKTEEARITPFNIKLNIFKNINLRTGFNLNQSTSSNRGLNLDIKLGFEKLKRYSPKWNYYYGIDVNGTYINYNDRPNTTSIISTIPFIGFEVFLTKEFSLSYEPKLIYSFIKYEDPDSFSDKISYAEEFRLSGLSQFFINFNF